MSVSTPTHLKHAVDGGSGQHTSGQRSPLPGPAWASGWRRGTRGGRRAMAPLQSREVGPPKCCAPWPGWLW